MIELTDDDIIGKGNDRVCYKHPLDSTKCIKITHPPRILANGKVRKKGAARRVAREVAYYKKLQRSGYDFTHVASYYGLVETSRGVGHAYELLRSVNGDFAQELVDVLKANPGDLEKIDSALETLFTHLYENAVPLAELHGGNICCMRQDDGSYHMSLVDGIGNSDVIKFCDWLKPLMRKKLMRKFHKALTRLGTEELQVAKKWMSK